MVDGLSNEHLDLTPTCGNNSRVLEYDYPAIQVGVAEYQEGPTGCTVFHFPQPMECGIDVRGGSPSTFTTDNHNFSAGERTLDAVCFTGGSVHGLEAGMGVTSSILALNNYSRHQCPELQVPQFTIMLVEPRPFILTNSLARRHLPTLLRGN